METNYRNHGNTIYLTHLHHFTQQSQTTPCFQKQTELNVSGPQHTQSTSTNKRIAEPESMRQAINASSYVTAHKSQY